MVDIKLAAWLNHERWWLIQQVAFTSSEQVCQLDVEKRVAIGTARHRRMDGCWNSQTLTTNLHGKRSANRFPMAS